MPDLSTVIVFPLLVAVAALILEYWVIKPLRKKHEVALPTSSQPVSRDWATAVKRAIKQFKAQQSGYNWRWWLWWLKDQNTVTIEDLDPGRGKATLILAVSKSQPSAENPVPGVLTLTTEHRVVARYQIVIDRTGDILKIDSLPVKIARTGSSPVQYQDELPTTTLVIKNRRKPLVENIGNEVRVTIEFDVENSGRAGKVCPYIEFRIVTTRGDGRYTPKTFRSDPMAFDIPALCIKPFSLKFRFPLPDAPLVKSSKYVKVELYRCPDTQL
jgi:hypothetical protein